MADRDEAEKPTISLFNPRNRFLQMAAWISKARIVAENWKEFGLLKSPPPLDNAIDLSYWAEARK